LDRLHEEYRPRIHRYLTRLVGLLDADDVTQLVFLRASQALPEFRGQSSIGTWLYRIARNAALDWRRSRSRALATHEALVSERTHVSSAEPDDTVLPADEVLVRREMQQCLRGVIAEMPAADRDVLAFRELDGMPTAEIADELGVSLATAKIRLHRARGRLRSTLTDCCTFTRDGRHGFGCERKNTA
jgi:RNA polymerase sigma-70 factor (ECF subfamily)